MADDERLIDVSEFEEEISENDLTEVVDDEELTPLKERHPLAETSKPEPTPPIRPSIPKRGTFIATLRERFAAFFIDSVVLFYLYWIYSALYCKLLIGSFNAPIPFSGWHSLGLHASFLLVCFLYYFVLEGIFLATVGKFVCWMSVRNKAGEPASLISVFVRNLIRPIDYILIIPVAFIMEITKFRQRIGDVLSGTTVVKKIGTASGAYDLSRTASASGRTIAVILDLLFFVPFLTGYILIWSPKIPFITQWLLLATPLVMLLYFILIEMATETSPGKWAMGYITCHDNNRRLSISGSIIRSIWRLFDTNPVGLLCLFVSSKHQRPGDLAAGTIVIKGKRTAKGAIGILIAFALAATTLYFGMTNKTNILAPKFRFNFLPKLSFIESTGFFARESGELLIKHFRFAAGEPNNLRVPPTFKAGETVYLIFELSGYTKRERKIWIQEDIAVKYPDGKIGLNQSNIVDYREILKGSNPIELTNNIELPENATPGYYQILITIRDRFSGARVVETEKFFVRRPFKIEPAKGELPSLRTK